MPHTLVSSVTKHFNAKALATITRLREKNKNFKNKIQILCNNYRSQMPYWKRKTGNWTSKSTIVVMKIKLVN